MPVAYWIIVSGILGFCIGVLIGGHFSYYQGRAEIMDEWTKSLVEYKERIENDRL